MESIGSQRRAEKIINLIALADQLAIKYGRDVKEFGVTTMAAYQELTALREEDAELAAELEMSLRQRFVSEGSDEGPLAA